MNKFFVFLCVMLLSFGIGRIVNAQANINTINVNDLTSRGPVGEDVFGSTTGETFGQTFTVDSDTVLESFTFILDVSFANMDPWIGFIGSVMKWDGNKAVGDRLVHIGGTISALEASEIVDENDLLVVVPLPYKAITINTEGLNLASGQYVAFITTTNHCDEYDQGGICINNHLLRGGPWHLAQRNTSVYAAGDLVLLDSNDDFNLLTAAFWNKDTGTDAAFAMTFAPSSPEDQLVELIGDVMALNLQQGISNSLDAKLDGALQAIDDVNENNDIAAINKLQAFINAVEAQRGNKITTEQADTLIAAAQAIIASLGG